MEEVIASKFQCWRADLINPSIHTIKAGNAREAAIKAAPIVIMNLDKYDKDTVLIRVKNDKGETEDWRVSIQRKFTLNPVDD